ITNMANISAHLFQAFADAALPSSSDSEGSKVKRVNWLGFYYVDSTRPTTHLVLGPFNGKPACTQINVTPDEGKGVCAASFKKSEAVIVSDVHHFDGHIACDAASQSEIVVPVIRASDGKTVGVLDVDSPDLDTFDEQDKLFFETVAALVSEASDW
ncbi:GAF domain-like protein, partial [Ramicandelaber brevisporus]